MNLLDRDAARVVLDRRVAEGLRYGRGFAIVRLQLPADALADALPRLLDSMRDADVLAHWGEEELLAILPETSSEGAARAAERLRDAVRDVPMLAGAAHFLGDESADALLGRAAWARARA